MKFEVRRFRRGAEAEFVTGLEWLFAPPGSRPPDWNRDRAVERTAQVLTQENAALFAARSPEGQLVWACDHGADYVFLESGVARTEAHRFYLREGATQAAAAFRWTTKPTR